VQTHRIRALLTYITGDILAAMAGWCLFYLFRKLAIEHVTWNVVQEAVGDIQFRSAILLIPAYWVVFYFLFNFYTDVYRKSRLSELTRTAGLSLLGCVILFFLLLLDDRIKRYHDYYLLIGGLYVLHTAMTMAFRMTILTYTKSQVADGRMSYNTVIVGGTGQATQIYKSISKKSDGFYRFMGFVSVNEKKENGLSSYIPCLGNYADLTDIIEKKGIEEVIIAIESSEHSLLYKIINQFLGQKVRIRILPDAYDFITGNILTGDITGEALIEIEDHPLLPWQRVAKRLFDLFFSAAVLLLTSPLLLVIALKVKMGSPGPVFLLQERLGQYGQPFNMVKFRSMFHNAEEDGPQLSRTDDPRITPFGRTLRKYRLDELPQFFNVILGNMSVIGPRPERSHFIDQITKTAPEYKLLLRIRPGITSWGMVQFGYASTVEEMITRMRYDLLYLHNQSITLDIKILLYTVLIILKGKGK